MGGARIKDDLRVVVVRVRVCYGYGAQFGCLFREFRRAGKLRSHVHNPDQAAAAVVELFEALKIRLLQVVRVLGAPLLIGEVGAFHLDAHEPGGALLGLVRHCPGGGEGLLQYVVGQGHGGGGKGGDTNLGVPPGHGPQTLQAAVGEVRAGVAVAVDIHQAGDDRSAAQVHRVLGDGIGQNPAKTAVLYLKGAGMEPEIGCENSGVLIKHNISLLIYSRQWVVTESMCIGVSLSGKTNCCLELTIDN